MSLKVILFFVTIMSLTFNSNAQWEEIGLGTGLAQGHNDLHFTSIDTGYIVGGQYVNQELSGYVLRTHNGGASWDTTYFSNKVFRAVHFPTVDTGYIAFIGNVRLGFLRTVNGGESWVTVSDSIVVANPPSLDITFFDKDKGVVSMAGATFLTENSGENWNLETNNPFGATGDIDSHGMWYASTGGGNIVYSSDGCDTYDLQSVTNSATGIDLSLNEESVGISFLGGFGSDFGYPYFNFSRLLIGNIIDLVFVRIDFPLLNKIDDIDYASETVLYGIALPFEQNGAKFIKSVDSGQSWFKQGTTAESMNYHLLQENLFCVNDTVCYAASGKVIYKTTNGGGPLLDPIESIVLSTENPKSEIEFNVFPNPSTGNLTLESEAPLQRISVFDAVGRQVLRESIQNQTTHQLNLGLLPKGLYLLQISGDGFEKTEKVVLE